MPSQVWGFLLNPLIKVKSGYVLHRHAWLVVKR
jgi:hypothetical protein